MDGMRQTSDQHGRREGLYRKAPPMEACARWPLGSLWMPDRSKHLKHHPIHMWGRGGRGAWEKRPCRPGYIGPQAAHTQLRTQHTHTHTHTQFVRETMNQ